MDEKAERRFIYLFTKSWSFFKWAETHHFLLGEFQVEGTVVLVREHAYVCVRNLLSTDLYSLQTVLSDHSTTNSLKLICKFPN
jgi:hypothetical protein